MARTTEAPLQPGEWRGGTPLTTEQLARMERGRAELAGRRAAACVRLIVEKRRARATVEDPLDPAGTPARATGEVNCATCDHLTAVNAEHQKGWCSWLRVQRSTWHPIICKAFTIAA